MRPKFFYVIFAAFVTLIFISVLINIWINSEFAKIKPEEKEMASQQTIVETPGIALKETPQSVSVFVHRPAITVIKPPAKEKAVGVLEEKTKEIESSTKSSSSAAPPPAPQSAIDNFKEETAPRITGMINKSPSEAESREMDEKGIIIW